MTRSAECYAITALRSYLHEQLDAESEAVLLQHIDGCSFCRQNLAELSDDVVVRGYFEASQGESARHEEQVAGGLLAADCPAPQATATPQDWLAALIDQRLLPKRFGKFELRQQLGQGGFGTVYLAEDTELSRQVAIKIPHLLRMSPGFRRRFLREGKAAACLHHRNIVSVLEAGEHDDVSYLVTEYIQGPTLREYLLDHSGGLDQIEAARLVLSLARAVEHAHQNSIVHRDIKPSNVLLDQKMQDEGLSYRPLLTDFGTAKICDLDKSATVDELLVGTVAYMAPEQIKGDPVGRKSDIYSLGVVLFEAVAGRLPVVGEDSTSVMHRVTTMHIPELYQIKAGISRDLSAICSKCLEKEPAARYANAGQLVDDLRRVLSGVPTIARPLSPLRKTTRWCRRNPLALSLMMAPLLTLIVLASVLNWHVATLGELNQHLEAANLRAIEQRQRAEASERRSRSLLYAADMRLAELAWRGGDLRNARELLARQIPAADECDLRGLEWSFLNASTHSTPLPLARHPEWLYCLAQHPSGERFAVAGSTGIIHVHDASTGRLLENIDSGQLEVNELAYSPSGSLLASTGDDGSLKVWRNGELFQQFAGHDGKAFGVEFLGDDNRLATCGTDALVKLWDVSSGEMLASFGEHQDDVETLAVSPSGRLLASVGQDQLLVVHDLEQSQLLLKIRTQRGKLADVEFSPDEKFVATATSGGTTKTLAIYEIASGRLLVERATVDSLVAVCFSADGDELLVTDRSGILHLWKVLDLAGQITLSDNPVAEISLRQDRTFAAELVPNRRGLLTVGESGEVLLSSYDVAKTPRVVTQHSLAKQLGVSPDALALRPLVGSIENDRLLAAIGGALAIIGLDNPEATRLLFPTDGRSWEQAVLGRDGDYLIGCGVDVELGRAVLRRVDFDTGDFRDLCSLPSVTRVGDLALSPDGLLAAVTTQAGEDGHKLIQVLETATGRLLHVLPAASDSRVKFLPSGQKMIFMRQREIVVFDLQTGRDHVLENSHQSSQHLLALSADGNMLATADQGREVKLWRLPDCKEQATLVGHVGQLTELIFSADGRTLFSASVDGSIKAWSVASGRFAMNLRDPQQPGVSWLRFDSEERELVYGRNDGAVCRLILKQ